MAKAFFFLGHFLPRITTVKVFDFLAFSAKDTNGESFCFFLVIFGQGYQRWKLYFFLVIFGQGYQRWSFLFFLVNFGQGYQQWKFWSVLFIFGQGYQQWKLLFYLGHFWSRLPMVKVSFCMDIFGQVYFYWPLWLWIPVMKVMFVIWDFDQALASLSARREFAFAWGNCWHPTVQPEVRAPGGNSWHGIASTNILVHQ